MSVEQERFSVGGSGRPFERHFSRLAFSRQLAFKLQMLEPPLTESKEKRCGFLLSLHLTCASQIKQAVRTAAAAVAAAAAAASSNTAETCRTGTGDVEQLSLYEQAYDGPTITRINQS